MFDWLTSGLLALGWGHPQVKVLKPVNWADRVDAVWVQSIGQPEFALDPAATLIAQSYITNLARLRMPASTQGLWVQSDRQVLVNHQGTVSLPVASLTKIATTLVALETWKPDHQFETLVGATGPTAGGVLKGDLVIQGGGDPLFVWEEAIALGNALNRRGITRVAGNLVITGNFVMNYETSPVAAGVLLKQGLNSALWNEDAEAQYATLPPGTPRPKVIIDGAVQLVPLPQINPQAITPLIRHQSLPLVEILKAQNVYSNNVIASLLADQLGGGAVVAEKAAELANVPSGEIQLVNGSGLGMENRISPRTVCAMLLAIQHYLEPQQLTVADLLPVAGLDAGTVRGRSIPMGSAVKTGTLDEVSSLAGVLPTRDRGLVWFTIVNVGTADLYALHTQQDALLQALQRQWGIPIGLPTAILPSDRITAQDKQLGNPNRNQMIY